MTRAITKPKKRVRPLVMREPFLELPDGAEFYNELLMDQYKLFVNSYLSHRNATKASIEAGFVKRTPKLQNDVASKLMQVPIIRRMLIDRARAVMARHAVTVDRVWQEIARLAFSNIADCIDDAGVRQMGDIPEDAQRAITGYKIKRTTINTEKGGDITTEEREVKMASKIEPLGKLMVLLGMAKDEEGEAAGALAAKFLLAMQEGRKRAFIEHNPKGG